MRIIAGRAGRTRLDVPRALIRPTTDRVREALFSILGARVEGARVLDLFAGSGALGLEALSRGAREAVFVDQSAEACGAMKKNLERAGLERGEIQKVSVESYLAKAAAAGIGEAGRAEPFDLIFADPPYRKKESDRDYVEELLGSAVVRDLLDVAGVLIVEMAGNAELPGAAERWDVFLDRKYGDTRIVMMRRRSGV